MILKRYIYREILSNLGWIIGFLLLILGSHRFVEYLGDAAAGEIPADLVLQMLIMKLLAMLPKILPVALFLGVILALSRLSQDRELEVVASAGVSERFKIFSVLKFSGVFAVLVFISSFYLSPWAEGQVRELRSRAELESDLTGISAGKFREFSQGEMVVYIEGLDRDANVMRNVFLQSRQNDELGVLNAASARYYTRPDTGSRYVLFENGSRYVGEPGESDYQIINYRTYAVLLEQGEQSGPEGRLETMPSSELYGSDQAGPRAELQWRLSFVIAAVLLALFALAINRHTLRDSRYLPIFICVLVYLIYSNMLSLSKTLLERGDIPVYLGLWWVHLLLLAAIVVLLNHFSIKTWFRQRLARQAS